jgi:hypothetical protein
LTLAVKALYIAGTVITRNQFTPIHADPIAHEAQHMNRNPIVTTTRSQLGAWSCVRAANAHMSRQANLLGFDGASPGPGSGGVSS